MIDSAEWVKEVIVNYPTLQYLFIVMFTAVGGELALLVLGFLAGSHIVSITPAVALSFVGAFLPNLIWFGLGGTPIVGRFSSRRRTDSTFSIITEAVQRVSRGSHLAALIIIKFLIGTPVLLVMYTQKTGLTLRNFFLYQSVATLLSILVIMPVGYISARGFSYLSNIFENLYAAIGFILLVIVLIVIFQVWLEKRFTDKI
jgi:membrane protein DedA with SNARE-associated domain